MADSSASWCVGGWGEGGEGVHVANPSYFPLWTRLVSHSWGAAICLIGVWVSAALCAVPMWTAPPPLLLLLCGGVFVCLAL